MALAAQARRRHVSDAFRGAWIRKDLGRPRQPAPRQFDIGVRSSKDEKQVPGGGTLPPEDEYPPVNQARCSNKLLEHLEHLHETNDLFGNLAKYQSEGK
jgi:hypothetical protein